MKNKKGKSSGRTAQAAKDKAKMGSKPQTPLMKTQTKEQFDDLSQKSNKEQSEEISRAVGGNVRRKVQIAFEADLAAKKRELEIARKED